MRRHKLCLKDSKGTRFKLTAAFPAALKISDPPKKQLYFQMTVITAGHGTYHMIHISATKHNPSD